MKFTDEFRRSALVLGLSEHIHRISKKGARLMEFCGGHTVAIFKYGIRQLLPPNIEMLSGPGCPVCVTDSSDIDKAISLSRTPGVIVTTFGDMLKVPGSYGSLQEAKAEGADVRIVYSTLDALDIARRNPNKAVVFLGIGFETTAPTIAVSILQAKEEGIKNYSVLSLCKLCPPVIKALLDSGEVRLSGLICPGHVSAVIGSHPWEFIARNYGISCVISGFEPLDILQSIDMLATQIAVGKPGVEIAYRRGVRPQGNREALASMARVFEESEAGWRGIGGLPDSGLKIRQEFKDFDAERLFEIKPFVSREPEGCICGDILRGVKTPKECELFARGCTPEKPVGPCMVSSEGSCAAYYSYGDTHGG